MVKNGLGVHWLHEFEAWDPELRAGLPLLSGVDQMRTPGNKYQNCLPGVGGFVDGEFKAGSRDE